MTTRAFRTTAGALAIGRPARRLRARPRQGGAARTGCSTMPWSPCATGCWPPSNRTGPACGPTWTAPGCCACRDWWTATATGWRRRRLPRPGAELPLDFALLSFEGKLLAAAVTTVFHGTGFENSFARGVPRTVEGALEVCRAIDARQDGRVDHRLLYRLDVRSADGLAALRERLANIAERVLVSHEDHTPGQGQYADRRYYERYIVGTRGMSEEEAIGHVDGLIAERDGRLGFREDAMSWLGEQAHAGRIRLLGHDLSSAAEVEELVERGGSVAEFPTTLQAAEAARERGHAGGDGRAEPVARQLAQRQRVGARTGGAGAGHVDRVGLPAVWAAGRRVRVGRRRAGHPARGDRPGDVGSGGRRRAGRPWPAGAGAARRPRADRNGPAVARRAVGSGECPMSHIGWPVPEPEVPAGTHPALADAVRAAAAAFGAARRQYDRAALAEKVQMGADGTPTMRLDILVDTAVAEVVEKHRVNLLSEEIGVIDNGSPVTLVVDPVDGTANAAAGVPLSAFAGVVAVDGVATEALTCWFDTGRCWHAVAGRPTAYRTTGRTALDGAAVSLLRPHGAGRRRVVAGRQTRCAGADPVDELPGGRTRRRRLDAMPSPTPGPTPTGSWIWPPRW